MGYRVLFYSDYQSVYGGNLISSLRKMEMHVVGEGGSCVWVFSQQACERPWCQELVADGHDVVFRPATGTLGLVRWLKDLVKEREVDVVHVHLAKIAVPALVGWIIPSLKVFYQVHSDWSLGRGEPVVKKIKSLPKRFLTSRVFQVAVSRELGEKLGCPYVENGIDLLRVHGLDELSRADIRKRYGVCDDSILVTVYAWSPEVKGLDVACAAVDELRKRGYDFQLGVVCAEDVGQTKRWIDEKTSVPSSSSWLHFLEPVEDVFDYHAIADIVLSASRSEGFSYVLCEAILAGKPCVASDIPGTKWSGAFETVGFFESENYLSCAEALARVNECRRVEGFDEALRRSAEKCSYVYNTQRWAKEMYAIYDDVCAKESQR